LLYCYGLSRRYDGSHHHEWDLLWARSPIRERLIRWQIWHSKVLVDGGPDLRRSRLASNSNCIVLYRCTPICRFWQDFSPLSLHPHPAMPACFDINVPERHEDCTVSPVTCDHCCLWRRKLLTWEYRNLHVIVIIKPPLLINLQRRQCVFRSAIRLSIVRPLTPILHDTTSPYLVEEHQKNSTQIFTILVWSVR